MKYDIALAWLSSEIRMQKLTRTQLVDLVLKSGRL